LRVDVDEDDFDRGRIGLVALDHFAHTLKQHLEPARQIGAFQVRGLDGAAGHVAKVLAVHVDHAEAGSLQAGVYA
jgi:hypothetical protein